MIDSQLGRQLSNVADRIVRLAMWRRLTRWWILLSVLVAVWAIAGGPLVPAWGWFLAAGTVGIGVLMWSRSRSLPRPEVARRIEQAFPDLDSRLLAAIEQQPDSKTGELNVLQRQVIAETVHHSRMNDWADSVPGSQITRAFFGQTAALVAFCLIGILAFQNSSRTAGAVSRSDRAARTGQKEIPVTIEPGNADIERGTSPLILARFQGTPPADVSVVWKSGEQPEQRMSLTKSLDDPIFATRLPALKHDLTYHVEFDGRQTGEFTITAYDLPALVRSDFHLNFPTYTGLAEAVVEDAFETSVVEGTRIRIVCHLNKPGISAKLVAADGTAHTLQRLSADPSTSDAALNPPQSIRLKLELLDSEGRKNRDPEEFRIDVVPNRVPELTLAFPGKDVKVSPLEEVQIEAATVDDFGVLEAGLIVQVAGRDPVTLPLAKQLKGGERHKLASIQRLEEFRVQPDELITYYLYAIDYGPDGQPRETNSDVYFAEVRSFDEIYRQIDQKSPIEIQSQQKPSDSLGKLIELQRNIIVATWKQVRTPKSTFVAKTESELTTVHDGQQQALEKLQAIRERMSQPQLQSIFAGINSAMENASRELKRAISEKSFAPLRPAVALEQSAYQGLLKLRAKEHMLMQSQGTGNSSESEEKLDLELKQNKDRYESEKAGAKKEETNVNREALAILDRLKDLSRRQDGINQQLKELEAQLRQAKNDADREEFERQLKRLREDQQQLLHDADELRNRLNKAMQQDTVTQTKDQLEQTRQRMVETAEKLREGQLSQALSAGTRAERELKQLADDFRKQTAAQFADALRNLRDDTRRLAEREKQLGQELEQFEDGTRRSLRISQEREKLQAEFQQQQQIMNDVVEHARKIVEQAESSEPLLAKQLYDTLRSARDSKLDQALGATQQLLKQGIVPEALKAEKQAQAGLDQLKQGIEKAAESVLGNEVDSLKRARKELAELSEQLGQEIQTQSDAGRAKNPTASANGQAQPSRDGDVKVAQSGSPSNQPGNSQPGDAQGAGNAAGTPNPAKSPGSENGQGSPGGNGQDANNPDGEASGAGRAAGQGTPGGQGSSTSVGESGKPSLRSGQTGLRQRKPGKPSGGSRPDAGREGSESEESGGGGSSGNSQGGGPLTGDQFTEFNERLRDVESMVSDPQLQVDVQKVRDRARSVRAEFKRHTNTPNWELVRTSVHQPMLELQQRLADEIAKRESPESLVPVDRDPVPVRYRDLVRQYYERLGAGKTE